jgi:hypothetical protein
VPVPLLPANVNAQKIDPRERDPRKNVLEIALPSPGIRRAYIVLQTGTITDEEWNRIWWTLQADVMLAETFDGLDHISLLPGLLEIAPLTTTVAHVATAYWVEGLPATSIRVRVSSYGEQPSGYAQVYGWGDTTPHDKSGLWPAPYGHVRQPRRIVAPLPDPEQTLGETSLVDFLMFTDRIGAPPREPQVKLHKR